MADEEDFRGELAEALGTSPDNALDVFADRFTVTNLDNMDIALKLTASLLAFHKPKAPKIPDVSLRLWLETCGAGVADSEELAQELMVAVATANCSAAGPLMAVALWETRSFHLTAENFEQVFSRARELAMSTPAQFQAEYETLALGATPSEVVADVADKIDRFLAISAESAVEMLEGDASFIGFTGEGECVPSPELVFVDARTAAEREEDRGTVSELSAPGNDNEHKRIVVVKLRKALFVDDEIDFRSNDDIRCEFFLQKIQLLSGQGAVLCVLGSNLDEHLATVKRVCRVTGGFPALRDAIIERDDIALLDALTVAGTAEYLERQEKGDFPEDERQADSESHSLVEQLSGFAKGGLAGSLRFVKKGLSALPLGLKQKQPEKNVATAAFVISESPDSSPVSPARLAEEAKAKLAKIVEKVHTLKKGDVVELSDLRLISGTREFFVKKVVSKDKVDKKIDAKARPPPPPPPSTGLPPPPPPPTAPADQEASAKAAASKAVAAGASAAMKGLNSLWKGAKAASSSILEKISDGSVEFPRVVLFSLGRILVFDCTSGRATLKSNHRVRELAGFSFDDKASEKIVIEVRGKPTKKIYVLKNREEFVEELNAVIQAMQIKAKTTEEVKRPSISSLLVN